MDYLELLNIMEQLQEIDSKKAYKLCKLIMKFKDEKDYTKRKEIERRIKNFIYHLFCSCLDRSLGKELANLGVSINSDRYDLEQIEKSWFVGNEGAVQFKITDGQLEEIGAIPRYHGEGFVLDEDATDEEKRFLMMNHSILNSIARDMDRKEEIVTYYQPKDDSIPRDFTETLVDFIGFSRIDDIETKKTMK